MKIWLISDSHCMHKDLIIPEGIDMVIHAGDFSNQRDAYRNQYEALNFLEWYKSLKVKYKVLVAGNHDTSIEKGLIDMRHYADDIIYLQNYSITIEGIKIYGSPYTPSFGTGWAFNVDRDKIHNHWSVIPDNTDILITHGPPKGILDLTADGQSFFQCGCKALLDRVLDIQPKYHVFGHIHTELNCPNAGILQMQNCKTKFVNASVVNLDYDICNNGHVIEI